MIFVILMTALAVGGVHAGSLAPLQGAQVIPAPDDVKAPPADAKKTASGLASKVIKAGTGTAHPGSTSSVTVHYSGWTTDGEDVRQLGGAQRAGDLPAQSGDCRLDRGRPADGRRRKAALLDSGNLAYDGAASRPGVPHGMLVFDIELLKIN
jgi:FKBP-type peptidyl-prolyl cis-trans isomerases 1